MKSTTASSKTSKIQTSPASHGMRAAWARITDRLEHLIDHSALALVSRIAVAAIFFLSGRTKVDGVLTVNDSAISLFQEEYRLPLISAELGAYLAAYAEHVFPILLVLGLFTRFSALALLGMVAVIQIFVYPDAWPTHLSWAALLLYLVTRGAGSISLDHIFKIR
jgi:putative oxidoreductase